jgi:Glutamate-cysteine ligase.
VLTKVRKKYKEYGIQEKPFVIVKADAGTYGMGVMTVRDPSEGERPQPQDPQQNERGQGRDGSQRSADSGRRAQRERCKRPCASRWCT